MKPIQTGSCLDEGRAFRAMLENAKEKRRQEEQEEKNRQELHELGSSIIKGEFVSKLFDLIDKKPGLNKEQIREILFPGRLSIDKKRRAMTKVNSNLQQKRKANYLSIIDGGFYINRNKVEKRFGHWVIK